MAKKKNKSEIGRTVQTRDEYFFDNQNYRKPGYGQKGNYRKAVVIAQNGKDLALVKTTKGSPKGKSLKDEPVSKYRPYVETLDDNGNPIRYGKKFIPNPRKKSFTMKDVATIAVDCFAGKSQRIKDNRNKVRKMKGRPEIK